MKTCKKCNKRDLEWNKSWFEHSGRWQLNNHKNSDGEWCVNNVKKAKENKLTKKDFTICPLCVESNFGYCLNTEYEEHKRLHHPNGEVRTNEYFQC
tara:strand:+ start:1588 stop:1875 length:288 start_codon:yes stop_codon:yes gene_type:complete